MKRYSILLLTLLLCGIQQQAQLQAQTTTEVDTENPWYVGVKGGVSFGISGFKSFGEDKTRIGYNFGLLTGYTYSRILSAELSATLGTMGLGASSCCADYWLGADGVRHIAADLGKNGYFYKDIYSSVALQQYGLHLNIDLLPLFNRATVSRFRIMVSPAVYGVGIQATIKTTADDEEFIKNDKQLNLGIGADLSIGYSLTNNIDLRLSSGINNISGDNYDGIPNGHHKTNFIVNNNIAVVWRFGKESKVNTQESTPPPPRVESQQQIEKRIALAKQKQVEKQIAIELEEQKQIQLTIQINERKEIERQTKVAESIVFPKINFEFNVSADSKTKIDMGMIAIIKLLNENPKIDILIKGYADKYGTREVNLKVSLGRANAVKQQLTENGIAPKRIETIGMGVDTAARTNAEARRADIHLNVKQ